MEKSGPGSPSLSVSMLACDAPRSRQLPRVSGESLWLHVNQRSVLWTLGLITGPREMAPLAGGWICLPPADKIPTRTRSPSTPLPLDTAVPLPLSMCSQSAESNGRIPRSRQQWAPRNCHCSGQPGRARVGSSLSHLLPKGPSPLPLHSLPAAVQGGPQGRVGTPGHSYQRAGGDTAGVCSE